MKKYNELGGSKIWPRISQEEEREIQIVVLPLDRSGDLRAAIRSEYEAEEAAAAALLEEAV